jgi:hypothetical protein
MHIKYGGELFALFRCPNFAIGVRAAARSSPPPPPRVRWVPSSPEGVPQAPPPPKHNNISPNPPEPPTMDYEGQKLSELLFHCLILSFGGVGWIVGYLRQDFSYVFYAWTVGVALSVLVSTQHTLGVHASIILESIQYNIICSSSPCRAGRGYGLCVCAWLCGCAAWGCAAPPQGDRKLPPCLPSARPASFHLPLQPLLTTPRPPLSTFLSPSLPPSRSACRTGRSTISTR